MTMVQAMPMLRAEHNDMRVAVFNTANLSKCAKEFQHADGNDWHANDAKAVLILAKAPCMVRAEKLNIADDFDRTESLVFFHPVNRTSLNGVTGALSIITKEQGSYWFDWMVEDLKRINYHKALVIKAKQETSPSTSSYFEKG